MTLVILNIVRNSKKACLSHCIKHTHTQNGRNKIAPPLKENRSWVLEPGFGILIYNNKTVIKNICLASQHNIQVGRFDIQPNASLTASLFHRQEVISEQTLLWHSKVFSKQTHIHALPEQNGVLNCSCTVVCVCACRCGCKLLACQSPPLFFSLTPSIQIWWLAGNYLTVDALRYLTHLQPTRDRVSQNQAHTGGAQGHRCMEVHAHLQPQVISAT